MSELFEAGSVHCITRKVVCLCHGREWNCLEFVSGKEAAVDVTIDYLNFMFRSLVICVNSESSKSCCGNEDSLLENFHGLSQ
jgi:hypothetical protein